MESIKSVVSIATAIYRLVENVKANENQCRRVAQRVKLLEELVLSSQHKIPTTISGVVEKALRELCLTLESAEELIKKHTTDKWYVRIRNFIGHRGEFSSVNERLSDALRDLCGALQVENRDMMVKLTELKSKEEDDEEEDNAELKRLLEEQTKRMLDELKDIMEIIVDKLNKPSNTNVVIREIKPTEIKYKHPKEPFMVTSRSEVYKGEFCGFPVAIKRYINPEKAEAVPKIRGEAGTMKQFESPNILRMFGICIQDENGPNPQYLIIMEYCEKGSLREVLDSHGELTWTMKARMCLDAARGLYRLHHTEEESKVHGNIDSSKFLVAKDYTVKLGGFELEKTMMKKTTMEHETQSLSYSAPEMLSNTNHVHGKDCDIYSLGILMWEVATRKKPFDGLSNREIYQKVYQEKYQEELPDECPEELRDLINSCRAFDSFQRPSAGVLVDRLHILVAKLEEQ